MNVKRLIQWLVAVALLSSSGWVLATENTDNNAKELDRPKIGFF